MTRFELATPTLARLCATTAPHPHARISACVETVAEHFAESQSCYFEPFSGVSRRESRRQFSASICDRGRLAQLVARFLHTEEVIGSSPVSPTTLPRFPANLLRHPMPSAVPLVCSAIATSARGARRRRTASRPPARTAPSRVHGPQRPENPSLRQANRRSTRGSPS